MYERDTHFVETLKVASYPKAQNHVIFLDEVISDSSYYRNAILVLKTASQEDNVTIIHNTEGGQCHTASVFVAAMKECAATITGELCGIVASAGTKIALACDNWVIGDDVIFMVHTTTYSAYNSAEKLRDHVGFMDEWTNKLNTDTYTGFLTEEELKKMCEDGKEYWFNAEQLKERLSSYAKYRESQHSSAMEEMFTLQNEQSEKYEEVLIKRLLATGEITQAEADIARKVQAATISLDEKEGDSLFETMNNPCEDNTCCMPEDSGSENLILSDIKGTKWHVDFTIDENDNIYDIFIGNTDEDYYTINKRDLSDMSIILLKALADDWEIPYVHNIGVEKLSDKIVSYFELEIIEFLSE